MNNHKMRILRIVEGTSVDGPGLRTSIYFAGCRHACPGCHNQQSWDFAGGQDYTVEDVMKIVRYNGFPVTFSGGDPMYQAEAILPLARQLHAEGFGIWCYTGFTLDELLADGDENQRAVLKLLDVLVDGPFVQSLRDTDLRFRGSSNQRLIDVRTPDFKEWAD
ncbi:MAG: anaerobic ribonucleoside-triphosphate reductase activating protein [Bacteroidales bacterium]|nr:anaerobic ribonucleoside-triphosphate reductase activating protein [Bacteroidales bacterium]